MISARHANSQLLDSAFHSAQTLVPLKSLRPGFLEDLFRHAAVQNIFTDEVLFEASAVDLQNIYLLHGDMELIYPSGHKELIEGRNQVLPLVNQQPRPCRAVAIKDSAVLRIDSDRLDRTLSWSQVADYLVADLSAQRDLGDDLEWMQLVLNSNLFIKVPPVNVSQIFDRLTPTPVHAGEVVIRQGEIGDSCFFVKEGQAEVLSRPSATASLEKIAEIGVGRCFGEDALVNGTVRNATVKMLTNGELMRLEKSDFILLLKEPVVEELSESDISELSETPVYIDVRTDDEYSQGHLAFSANLPLSLLSIKKRLLSTGKSYIFYCDTGRRSRAAAWLMGKDGYDVFTLKGGYIGAGMAHSLVSEAAYVLQDGNLGLE